MKKENIGLIEVMGLAVLPSRLKSELADLGKAMLENADISKIENLKAHGPWADEIKAKANTTFVTVERVSEIEAETKHDIASLSKGLSEVCEGEAGEYVHFGATSNDIVDSSNSLLLKDSIEVLEEKIERLTKIILKLAEENKMKVCIGRTHGQHALPTTYGMKFAIWADELHRQYDRLLHAKENVCLGMMDGPVGTTAALGTQGWEVHKKVSEILGLKPAPITNQVLQREHATSRLSR